MLTEADWKWLNKRKVCWLNFCDSCLYKSTTHHLCYTCITHHEICPTALSLGDFRDAAEFEARVAAKLALTYDGPEPCERNEEVKHCPWAKRVVEGKMTCKFCRLKHARLVVEREMDEVST